MSDDYPTWSQRTQTHAHMQRLKAIADKNTLDIQLKRLPLTPGGLENPELLVARFEIRVTGPHGVFYPSTSLRAAGALAFILEAERIPYVGETPFLDHQRAILECSLKHFNKAQEILNNIEISLSAGSHKTL